MKYEIVSLERKRIDSIQKDVINCDMKDEQGNLYDKKVSIWEGFPGFTEIIEGSTVEGDIIVNDKGYASLKAPKAATGARPNMDRLMDKKKENIIEVQGKRGEQISKAQDRNEVMWSKYGACELVAHHPSFASLSQEDVIKTVSRIASEILNDDLQPF